MPLMGVPVPALALAGLTPELSRTVLRPRQWFNLSAISAAAKRSRLERIVRRQLLAEKACVLVFTDQRQELLDGTDPRHWRIAVPL